MKNLFKISVALVLCLIGIVGCAEIDPDIYTKIIFRNECSKDITMKSYYNKSTIKIMEQDTITLLSFGFPELDLGNEIVLTKGTKEIVFRRGDDAPIFFRDNYKVLKSTEYTETLLYTFTDDMFE